MTKERDESTQASKQEPKLILGFRQRYATTREFVILLFAGLSIYVFFHIVVPPRSLSSSKALDAKISALNEIKKLKEEIEKVPTPSPSATPSPTPIGSNSILAKTMTENLQNNLQVLRQEQLKDIENIVNISTKLSTNLNELESKDVNSEEATTLLKTIYNDLISLERSLQEQGLFWSGNRKWLEVISWSLFGTLLYIIRQTVEYKLQKPKDDNSDPSKDILIRRKPQFYYFLLQSPFVTLVILWVLSMANLSIAGITIALGGLPEEVMISLAFILGFYNRVSVTQLDLIVGSIFKDAWQRTVRKIEINEDYDPQNPIKDGTPIKFSVTPDVKVKWSIWSKPSLGTIDVANGTFIPAPKDYYYEQSGLLTKLSNQDLPKNYSQVIIKAEREDEESISCLYMIDIKKYYSNPSEADSQNPTPATTPSPTPAADSQNPTPATTPSPTPAADSQNPTPAATPNDRQEAITDAVLESSLESQKEKGPNLRQVHAKSHGLVSGKFIVESNLPENCKVGVFSTPSEYEVLIRFSNGSSPKELGVFKPDTEGDARGLAIKLQNVSGEKVPSDEDNTQDFTLLNHHSFFLPDVEGYVNLDKFFKARDAGEAPDPELVEKLKPSLAILNEITNKVIGNPLFIQYWSTTPYKLGSNFIKFSVKPHDLETPPNPKPDSPNYLREAMVEYLTNQEKEAKYDFLVQFFKDETKTPIENPMQEWKQEDSPFIKVATITIPTQEFDNDTHKQLDESLSFTPWHTLPEHEPVGSVNLSRRKIYQETAKARREVTSD